jgi:hypothetical protein
LWQFSRVDKPDQLDSTAKEGIGEGCRITLAIFAGSAIPAGCGIFPELRLNRPLNPADLLGVKKGGSSRAKESQS